MRPGLLSPVRGGGGYSVAVAANTDQQVAGSSQKRRSITFTANSGNSQTGTGSYVLLGNVALSSITDIKAVLMLHALAGPVTIEGPIAQLPWHAYSTALGLVCVIEDQGEVGWEDN